MLKPEKKQEKPEVKEIPISAGVVWTSQKEHKKNSCVEATTQLITPFENDMN